MSEPGSISAGELVTLGAKLGPFVLVTSWVGLGSLPRASRLALASSLTLALAPTISSARGGLALALAQGVTVALVALAPLVASTTALEATARLGALPRGWDALFSSWIALSFLLLGGPSDLALALTQVPSLSSPHTLALTLAGAVMSGLSLAGPMLVGRVGVEALMAATSRAELGRTWLVARDLALWGVVALLARRLVFRAL